MMAKFFAIKTQAPDAPAIVEVPPVAPTLPQATVSVPVIQSPPVKPYEPIGRGRGAKTLLGVLIGAAVLYFHFASFLFVYSTHEMDQKIF